MNALRTSLIAAALLAGASLAAHAADLLDDVKSRGTLRIAVEGTDRKSVV